MRIEETFTVGRPPEVVFDYTTDPANLAAWQRSKTFVEPLTDGAMRLLQPVAERVMARHFVAYHRNLRRNVEGGGGLGA